ncbi:CcdC protein domain-containing protein [Paenibacillus sp. GCM10027628]|uniref:CcdC protein domain-containing protein n=1 Tax=Paenibacillus sp. GCM10027628 TaxID=3273413 RepID=UPI00362C689D
MTQQQWDLIGYGVWALIIWVTLKQFMQTRKEVKGSGLRLLFGDWLMFAALPWIFYCVGSRATLEQVGWTVGLGLALAIPYIVTSKFEVKTDGKVFFKKNILFYIFLFGFPYARYLVRDNVFHTHPILTAAHRPDIELMLALYISVLIIYTFAWRFYMYTAYKKTVKQLTETTPGGQAALPNTQS